MKTTSTQLHPDVIQLLQEHALSAIIAGEDVAYDTMTKKLLLQLVTEKLAPYTRGKIINYLPDKGLYKIRIPQALTGSKPLQLYARTEIDVLNRAYTALLGEPKKVTLESLWEEHIAARKADIDVATSTVERELCRWAKYYEGSTIVKVPVQDLRASDFKAFFKGLTAGRAITRKELNNVKSIAVSLLALAVDQDVIPYNAAKACDTRSLKCKAVCNRDKAYTHEERDKLLEYLDSQEASLYVLAISLMFCLGVRIGELKALTWDDYDPDQQTIHVWREIVDRKGDLDDPESQKTATLLDHTKAGEGGDRILPLTPRAQRYLQMARRRRPFGHFILESERGTPFRTNRFNEKLRQYCAAAGVRYLSSHKIRFYAVTAQAESGMSLAAIQYSAGHKSPQTTYGYMRAQGMADDQREYFDQVFG